MYLITPNCLSQLRKLAYKLIHSTTKLLPLWNEYIEKVKLSTQIMPRDVLTRWNSTYDMLKFALKYRQAIDGITADRDAELRAFELKEEEWKITQQLHDILEVC